MTMDVYVVSEFIDWQGSWVIGVDPSKVAAKKRVETVVGRQLAWECTPDGAVTTRVSDTYGYSIEVFPMTLEKS